jgi:ABC-2 type transport system permease protein
MSAAGTLTGFARHDLRLAWRETLAMLTAGRRGRGRNVVLALIVFAALLHWPAYAMVGRYADLGGDADRTALVVISGSLLLAWLLMLSQAIESVTRVFYARADLDLIMSSPVPLAKVFSVRMAAIALTVTVMALLFAAPVIDVLAFSGGAHWLAAFGVVVAIGISAAAVAIGFTVALFRLIGPKRTRLVAQILSVLIGAGFVISLQVAAILSTGTLSRFAVLGSDAAASFAPGPGSVAWWPVRAVLGDGVALTGLLGVSLLLLGAVMALVSRDLAVIVVSASNAAVSTEQRVPGRRFRPVSRQRALRAKELLLLRRDPWLVSQSLMQLLYLLPPALMLWRSFSESSTALVLITPVIVMAAGQLAGGLAWLTISGEDAPDLVATAPILPASVTRARIEVVLTVIAVAVAPLLLPLAVVAPWQAAVTALGCLTAAASATAIQLWFRVQGRRSQFRRRQTASRIATFAEAFASIGWAATAALALTIPVLALITGSLTALVLAASWAISPRRI